MISSRWQDGWVLSTNVDYPYLKTYTLIFTVIITLIEN